MAAGMIPRSQELPRLPEWNLSATHSDLHEQFIQTKVMLDTYEVFLSDLVSEYQTKASVIPSLLQSAPATCRNLKTQIAKRT